MSNITQPNVAPPAVTQPVAAPLPDSIIWPTAETERWLVANRNAGRTPADITTDLVAQGWQADAAATAALRSLRRSDRHNILYGALCWSAGLAAVGFTTGLHQLLQDQPDRQLAAVALTISVIAAPIAVATGIAARRTERHSSHAVWSPTRRAWFGTLATCTAVVGLVRLVTYIYRVIATLTDATPRPLTAVDLWQVAISLTVAIPLFAWSFIEWRRSNIVISGLTDTDTDPDVAAT